MAGEFAAAKNQGAQGSLKGFERLKELKENKDGQNNKRHDSNAMISGKYSPSLALIWVLQDWQGPDQL